jgi:E3 ubiquitin-protein ligase TRIP12
MFMRFVSFIAVDQQRALVFLKQHQKRQGNQKLRVQDRKEKQLERQ